MIRCHLAAVMLLVFPVPLLAQEEGRSIHWPEINVEARLDADGRLHVREHQAIVFDGAWNGGQRAFDVRLGQDFQIEGVHLLDPRTGETRPLVHDDDVDDVGEYDPDDDRVRWRSRLEDDPPFEDRRLDYVITYTLDNAVLPVDSPAAGYLLDHDFLFAEREGVVERFTLALTLDAAWSALAHLPTIWTAEDLAPGTGFAVRLPLRHVAPGEPATVPTPAPGPLRSVLILLLVGTTMLLLLAFFRREREAGRFEPLPAVTGEDWLEDHVFVYPAEVVGAAWDSSTSAPEVAGMLARLVQEGKLGSRVETGDAGAGAGDDPVLHLELKVPRDAFDPAERPLIDALFFDDRERTDTRTLREHYEGTGFDPAGKIAPALEGRLAMLPGRAGKPGRGGGVAVGAGGLVAGLALLVMAAVIRPTDAPVAALGFLVGIIGTTGALLAAAVYARQVVGIRAPAATFTVALTLMVLGAAAVIGGGLEGAALHGARSPYYHPGPLLLVALTLLVLATVITTRSVARATDGPERRALRRRLAAARAYFEDQLDRPDPDLRDAWFPYLLAFGLGPRIDRWFTAYGPTGDPAAHAGLVATTVAASATSSGAGQTSSGSGGWTGGGATFGGGGGFAGGGVGASWGIAAGTIATGVASPSAAGGASSGGGGGGGW